MKYTSFQILKVYQSYECENWSSAYYAKVKLLGERTKRATIWLGECVPTEESIEKFVTDYIEHENQRDLEETRIRSMIGKVIDL